MIFRPAVESDLDRLLPLLDADPTGGVTAEAYRAGLADGQYRFDRMWLAEDAPGGAPLALAVWWGSPGEARPRALDGLFASGAEGAAGFGEGSAGSGEARTVLAAGLLGAAHTAYAEAGADVAPEYHLFLPGDWRDRPELVAAVAWRREAARRAGLPASLERLRYEWTPQNGLPEPSGRLRFRAEPDDEVFVDLFRRVLAGTLDASSRKGAARNGAEAQAREDLAFYRDTMPGKRSWWRVARTPDGVTVGFGIPSRNHATPVVGYLGVLPEHRGRGYADEILAEITRVLAAEAAPERIRADTDLTNTPMAAAFARAGYRNSARRLVLSAR
ncbi:GNAT family N-acetyltransferase [Kitasatospora sp. NPDC088134]|uniref:GNAT family N-acetyltransferase n=1 Tax=Kitasatospora sp. NPDC088134 TaxID=3364071 RepID=UPI00382626A4